MTEYQVLQQHEAGVWTERRVVEAASAEAAVRQFADGLEEGGAFVAIPKRSFQPLGVEVETTTRVKLVASTGAQTVTATTSETATTS